MTLKKGDRVRWAPKRSDWTKGGGCEYYNVPVSGALGVVEREAREFCETDFPGGSVYVVFDGEESNAYPADYCILVEGEEGLRAEERLVLFVTRHLFEAEGKDLTLRMIEDWFGEGKGLDVAAIWMALVSKGEIRITKRMEMVPYRRGLGGE